MSLLKKLRLFFIVVATEGKLPRVAMKNLEQRAHVFDSNFLHCTVGTSPHATQHAYAPHVSGSYVHGGLGAPIYLSPILSKFTGATTLSLPPPIRSLKISVFECSLELQGWQSLIGFDRDFVDTCSFRVGPMSFSPGQLEHFLEPLALPIQFLQIEADANDWSDPEEKPPLGIADFASPATANRIPNVTTLVCSIWPRISQTYGNILCSTSVAAAKGDFIWPSLVSLVLQTLDPIAKPLGVCDDKTMEILRAGLLDRKHRGYAPLDRLIIRGNTTDDLSDLDVALRDCANEVTAESSWATHPSTAVT